MKYIYTFLFLICANFIFAQEYTTREIPVINNKFNQKDLFGQILSRSKLSITEYDRDTNAHETTHMIHSEQRNIRVRQNQDKEIPVCLFVLPNKIFDTFQPKFRKSQISEFVPKSLRYSRYNHYLLGAKDWDDSPLYIYDEWVAYINGASVSLDDLVNGVKVNKGEDTVFGPLEFSVYAIATCIAIEKYDPNFWMDQEFRNFTLDMLQKSESIYFRGKENFPFKEQEKFLKDLRTSPDAKPIRDFISKYFNNVWLINR